jgi:hypothetical protein
MGEAIWATWFDLPEKIAEDHLDWLHRTHIPALLALPGFAWATTYRNSGGGAHMDAIADTLARPGDEVPGGRDYVMMVGAPDVELFFNPRVDELEADIGGARLAQRVGVRTAVFMEQSYVAGPEMATRPRGGPTGPAIQFGSFRTKTTEDEWDLSAWYGQYRLPAMSAMTGCIATRKLVAVAGWVKHAVLYEFTSLEQRQEHFQGHESLALDQRVWTNKIINYTIHSPGSPVVGSRLWPPVADA